MQGLQKQLPTGELFDAHLLLLSLDMPQALLQVFMLVVLKSCGNALRRRESLQAACPVSRPASAAEAPCSASCCPDYAAGG
jgi:hypothetical protein